MRPEDILRTLDEQFSQASIAGLADGQRLVAVAEVNANCGWWFVHASS